MTAPPVIAPTLISPRQLQWGDDQVSPTEFGKHYLAAGDSWFSVGSMQPTSLLHEMRFEQRVLITSMAVPGRTLQRMVDWRNLAAMRMLLDGSAAWALDGVLLSAGGNDLIAALPALIRPGRSIDTCIDGEAWDKFAAYLAANVGEIERTVRTSSHNATTPIYLHTYDIPTPRDAPAFPGIGPWLFPAMRSIEPALWAPIAAYLMGQLGGLLMAIAARLRGVHVVASAGACTPAGSTADSSDWANEIHPNKRGYRKLAALWQQKLPA